MDSPSNHRDGRIAAAEGVERDAAPPRSRWKAALPYLAALLGIAVAGLLIEQFRVRPLAATNAELRRKATSLAEELRSKAARLSEVQLALAEREQALRDLRGGRAGAAPASRDASGALVKTAEQVVPSCVGASTLLSPSGAACDASDGVRVDVCATIPRDATVEGIDNHSDAPLGYFIWDDFERWTQDRRDVCWRFENFESHPVMARLTIRYSMR